ncbi:Tetracyclin repressor domain protein [Parafrankia sp. EAN1pec]|nr:Tetracyclin repressor domain protein [Frankia sp. EAN1pec]
MRSVAFQAGLTTDQIYRWVPSRDDLVGAMVERVVADSRSWAAVGAGAAHPELAHPRDYLERSARDEWALYRRHPWLLAVLVTTRPPTPPALLAMVDRTVAVLIGAGHDSDDAFSAYLTLSGYVQGMALLHIAERAELHAGAAAWDTWWSPDPAEAGRVTSYSTRV